MRNFLAPIFLTFIFINSFAQHTHQMGIGIGNIGMAYKMNLERSFGDFYLNYDYSYNILTTSFIADYARINTLYDKSITNLSVLAGIQTNQSKRTVFRFSIGPRLFLPTSIPGRNSDLHDHIAPITKHEVQYNLNSRNAITFSAFIGFYFTHRHYLKKVDYDYRGGRTAIPSLRYCLGYRFILNKSKEKSQ